MLNKKAFSVLEITFVIVIIAVISTIAVPKIFQNKTQTYLIKAKSDVALIRKAIKDDYSTQVMKQLSNEYIEKLDEAVEDEKNQELFSGVEDRKLLEYPLLSTDTAKEEFGKWIKLSNNVYQVMVESGKGVLFTYDNEDGKFECDKNEEYCLELMQ